jgi:hypothetical protein
VKAVCRLFIPNSNSGEKLEYLHYNPVEAGLTLYPEGYHYSSAAFYETGVDHFKMLTHYMG